MNHKKRLYQFAPAAIFGATLGLGCVSVYVPSRISISETKSDQYTIYHYNDSKVAFDEVGLVVFQKDYQNGKASIATLIFGDPVNKSIVGLTDIDCDGLVDIIHDADGSGTHYRGWKSQEEKFAEADQKFADFTTTGELADLIRKAEAKWKEKYGG